ncbi:hypothetical protein DPMN_024119 [Dreissena polymorpha]|uniref:Uncharacterized protein n=1 Tax=Dreissena polymorpha TaxID=45954 RepID=A0A9D4LQU0_DREPO|nr:hypothetical protein DPMN_024119 [Dreissena polymorpha]
MGKNSGDIRDQYAALLRQVRGLKHRYEDVYAAVRHLAEQFRNCKGHFAHRRYNELKEMIKTCITDEVLNAAANNEGEYLRPVASNTSASARLRTGTTSSTSKLLQHAEAYSRATKERTDQAVEEKEIKDLGKDELQKLLEEQKDLQTELHEKFIRLHENLNRLKHDYECSKRFLPVKRYWFLKEMVKPMLRNEHLKCL